MSAWETGSGAKHLGADNRSALVDVLGLDDEELERLEADGVLVERR